MIPVLVYVGTESAVKTLTNIGLQILSVECAEGIASDIHYK